MDSWIIDVYIPPRKYQVKPHSSPWFSVACVAAIVHRNHLFHSYQQNKSSESNVKFIEANYCCKKVLEAAKLAYANKTRVHHFPQTWLSRILLMPIVLSLKVNLLYLLYLTTQKNCILHLIKQHYLLETFLKTLILMTQYLITCFPF